MTSLDDRAGELLTRSFLLGTARNPVPAGVMPRGHAPQQRSASELAALTLVGQRLRFRRHSPPRQPDKVPPIEDARKIVPDAARPLMRKLLATKGGSATDVAALALADICNRRGLRPHPFDLPRLRAFVKAHAESLGACAVAFAAQGEEGANPAAGYFDADKLDASNWTSARPAARAEFISNMRRGEPDRARELVEASFTTDPAPIRARILAALTYGLSVADAPFLESLEKDRAPSVRDLAQLLLKRIPGTAAAEGRIRDLVARTKVSSSGLFRKRTRLTLELPANLQTVPQALAAAQAGRRWAAEEYAGVGLDAIAAAFGLAIAGMIDAAGDDPALLALFARQASLERRFDVLATIAREHAADAWIDAIGSEARGVAELSDAGAREGWCAAALTPELWPALPTAPELDRLYGFLRGPLPEAQARALLRSQALAALSTAKAPVGTIGLRCLSVAVLTPASLRPQLRAVFASLPPEETLRALLLLDCLALVDPASS
jgi:hypothetical protein